MAALFYQLSGLARRCDCPHDQSDVGHLIRFGAGDDRDGAASTGLTPPQSFVKH